MRIVHFSTTALAGQPISIVRALQRHTDWDVHLVTLDLNETFSNDLAFSRDREKVLELADKADIIHLHSYLDLASTEFHPIDFSRLKRNGKVIIRQFHSVPSLISHVTGWDEKRIHSQEIPSLCIAQAPERYYPYARVVPLVLPCDDPLYRPPKTFRSEVDLLFCASIGRMAWKHRWWTKGLPETRYLLQRLEKRTGCRWQIIQNMPLNQVMERKRVSRIVLEEMVTGTYHQNGLEGLCLARPTLAYLDARTERVMREISGSHSTPFVNVSLERAYPVLKNLLSEPELCEEVGQSGRAWMDRYWNETATVSHFIDIYKTLLDDPTKIMRQPALSLESSEKTYVAVTLPDLDWQARKKAYWATLPLHGKWHFWSVRQYERTRTVLRLVHYNVTKWVPDWFKDPIKRRLGIPTSEEQKRQ